MAWYNASWGYRVKVTVQSSQVDGNLTDYPVYVALSDLPAGFHTNVNSDGSDIRVTTSDETTECPREVVTYDSSGDTGELHFKAPSVSSSSNTDFYIYYGNSGASDYAIDATYGAENVWTNDFGGVWHFQDGLLDSTANDNDLTETGTLTYVTGKIEGKALYVNANDEWAARADASLVNISDQSAFTWGGWLEAKNTSKYNGPVNKDGNPGRGTILYFDGGDQRLKLLVWLDPTGNYIVESSATYGASTQSISADTWTYALGADDTTDNMYCWFNDTKYTRTSVTTSRLGSSNPLMFGADGFTTDGDCYIDEVRCSTGVRSDDWINADYVNQNSPNTFYGVGSEESAPAVGGPTIDPLSGCLTAFTKLWN